ncbi:MAG: zinc-finger domain-containing protein [Proteobacteria bacterium]|nr:zinc-finger domain-containing protein [Pseudomonadota bacterium]
MLKLFQKNKKAPLQAVPQAPFATPAGQEEVRTAKHRVACDGPSFSGHPRIYLEMGNAGSVVCPYCSRTFIYDAQA